MLASVQNDTYKTALVIRGPGMHIFTYAQNSLGVFFQCRITTVQIVQPQGQACFLIQHGVTQAIVERIQIATKKFRVIDSLGDCSQHSGTIARTIATYFQGGKPLVLCLLQKISSRQARCVEHTALLQSFLQSQGLAHQDASLKNANTSSRRLMVSVFPNSISSWV